MPTTRLKPTDYIRDRLGSSLRAIYVTSRNPVTGERYEPFGFLAVVDMDREDAYRLGGEIATEIAPLGIPIKVEPGRPEDFSFEEGEAAEV